ncbi:MAG: tetratricopeptide repeat protein [Candidatus Melainabacteria bacterium]
MVRIIAIIVLVSLAGLGFVFHEEIKDFSDSWSLAREATEGGDTLEQRLMVYEKGHQQHPGNLNIALKLAELYTRAEKHEKANVLYLHLLTDHADDMRVLVGYANLLKTDPRHLNKAIVYLKRAFKENPANPMLLYTLGSIYQSAAENPDETREPVKQWLYDWAVYYYRQAVRHDISLFDGWFGLGVVHQGLHHYNKAANRYCNALLLKPRNYEAHYNLGLVLVQLNRMEEAYPHFEEAIRLLSDSNRMLEAQSLAERVQVIKDQQYYRGRGDAGGTLGHTPMDDGTEPLNPACFNSIPVQ